MSEQEEVKRSYHVTIDVAQSHNYVVDDVNSPEEAEQVAQEWLDEGELGDVDNKEVIGIDSYPLDDKGEHN